MFNISKLYVLSLVVGFILAGDSKNVQPSPVFQKAPQAGLKQWKTAAKTIIGDNQQLFENPMKGSIAEHVESLLEKNDINGAYKFLKGVYGLEKKRATAECSKILPRLICEQRSASPFRLWAKNIGNRLTGSPIAQFRNNYLEHFDNKL